MVNFESPISEEESYFSDASESDVGSIFSDGGSSCDEEDSFCPEVATPCPYPTPRSNVPSNATFDVPPIASVQPPSPPAVSQTVTIPTIDSSTNGIVMPQPKPRDADSCSTVEDFYSLEASEITEAFAELSTEEGGETTVVKPRSKSLNDSTISSSNTEPRSPVFRTTRALTNVTNTKDLYSAQRSDMFTARKATTPIRKKIQTLQSKVSQGQLQAAAVESSHQREETTNQNQKWQGRKTILKDINNRRKALLNSSWENNTTENASGTNVFEMTMAEEDREDQKRRHRLSREKFENLF